MYLQLEPSLLYHQIMTENGRLNERERCTFISIISRDWLTNDLVVCC